MNNYLIYLSFGNDHYHRETLFSLLSFYKFHSDKDQINIIIYTDKLSFFKEVLPPTFLYRIIDSQQINEWKGSLNYTYRLKTKILQEVCANYKGNFLFVDTDTVFLKNSTSLFNEIEAGELLLDANEGKLIDNTGGIARKTKRFLKKQNTFSIPSDSNTITLSDQFVVWNSGTIGFTNTIQKKLLSVEELMDLLYVKSKIFIVEQIALSYYFQKIKQPKETKDFIHHYWDFKEFRVVLIDFFNHNATKNLDELISQIHKINPDTLSIEKKKYKKLTFLQKQWRKISTGSKWKIPYYNLN